MESQDTSGRGGGGGGSQRPRVSLLVRNLNFHSSPDDVRSAFSEFGPIRDVYLPLDFHTGEPRGFGFVEFESSKDAYDAMYAMHNTVLHGSTIHVTIAKKGRSDPVQMRRRELRGEFEREGPRSSHRDRFGRRWTSSRSPSRCRYRPQQRRGRSGSSSSGSVYSGAAAALASHGGKGGGDSWMTSMRGRDRSLSEDDRRPRPRSSKSRRSPSPYRGRRSASLSRSRSPGYNERRPFSSDDSEEDRISGRRERSRKEREELYHSRGRGSHSRRKSRDRESNSYNRRGSRSVRLSSRSRTSSNRRHSRKSSRSGERADSVSQGSEERVQAVPAAARGGSRTKESEAADGERDGRRNSSTSNHLMRQVNEDEDCQLRGSRSRRRSSTQTSEDRRPRSISSQRSKRRRSTSRNSQRHECGNHSDRDDAVTEREAGDRHAQEDAEGKGVGSDSKLDSRDESVTSVTHTNKEYFIRDPPDEEEITPNGHARSPEETETLLLTTDEANSA